MSRECARKIVRLVIAALVSLLVVVVYVFYRDYRTHVDVVKAARLACELTKEDRIDIAILNESVLRTFRASQESVEEISSPARRQALTEIDLRTSALKSRSKLNCNKSFPKASFFP